MRESMVLQKLRTGQPARLCGLGHFLPFFIRYAAHFRYDCIWLDLEHRAMTDREVQSLLAHCHLNNIDCMVRPATLERTRLTRYLEDGASGFMIPFVSTPEMARQIVDAVKFPPLGSRGFDGTGIDGDYGIEGWDPKCDYTTRANEETFVVAQIETIDSLSHVEEIAAVPGIDALFVGPSDLALRLEASPNGVTLNQAIERVASVARHESKAWGIAIGSADELALYLQMGARLIAWGVDFALVHVLENCSKEMDYVFSRDDQLRAIEHSP